MSTNPYRDSTAVDYLDKIRKHMLENRAGNTSSRPFTPQYIIPFAENIELSDTVVVDPNTTEVGESFTVSEQTRMIETTTVFRVAGGDFLTFKPLSGKLRDFMRGSGGFFRSTDERAYVEYSESS